MHGWRPSKIREELSGEVFFSFQCYTFPEGLLSEQLDVRGSSLGNSMPHKMLEYSKRSVKHTDKARAKCSLTEEMVEDAGFADSAGWDCVLLMLC